MEIDYRHYLSYLRADYRRYRATGTTSFWKVLSYQGFWATFFFRITTFLYFSTRSIPLIRTLVSFICLIALRFVQIITGISIPVGTKIGPGLYIAHYGLIIFNGGVMMGSNCNIGPLTIISGSRGKPGEEIQNPIIGNRVWIGPDVKIPRCVKIGNDAVIGIGSIVLNDVPDRAFVAGAPAQIIDFRGSFDLIAYDMMEHDLDRLESMKKSSRQGIAHE